MRTRSEEPYRANCCARYPLPEGVREYVVSRVMRSKRIARTPVLLPVGTPYHRTGKHCSVGRVLTMAMLPPSRHSWQGVQMDTSDSTWTQTMGTVTENVPESPSALARGCMAHSPFPVPSACARMDTGSTLPTALCFWRSRGKRSPGERHNRPVAHGAARNRDAPLGGASGLPVPAQTPQQPKGWPCWSEAGCHRSALRRSSAGGRVA